MQKMKRIATGRSVRMDRQRQAQERNAAYRALSVKDRITLVLERNQKFGGDSKRELARLAKLLAAEQPMTLER